MAQSKNSGQTTQVTVGTLVKGVVHSGASRIARRTQVAPIQGAGGKPGRTSQKSRARARSRRQTTQPTSASAIKQWGYDSEAARPMAPFGRGDVSKLFDCLPQVREESQGMYFAIVDLLTQYQSATPDREATQQNARKLRGEFLRTIQPNAVSLANAELARIEERTSPSAKGRPTGELRFYEEHYLRLVTGMDRIISASKIRIGLRATAEQLARAGSKDRQASAWAMLADVELVAFKDESAAAEAFAKCLVLMREHYPQAVQIEINGEVPTRVLASTSSSGSSGSAS